MISFAVAVFLTTYLSLSIRDPLCSLALAFMLFSVAAAFNLLFKPTPQSAHFQMSDFTLKGVFTLEALGSYEDGSPIFLAFGQAKDGSSVVFFRSEGKNEKGAKLRHLSTDIVKFSSGAIPKVKLYVAEKRLTADPALSIFSTKVVALFAEICTPEEGVSTRTNNRTDAWHNT